MKTVITFTVLKGFCDPSNSLETTEDTEHRAIIDTDIGHPLRFEARDTDALGAACWRRSNFVPDAVVAQMFLRLFHSEYVASGERDLRLIDLGVLKLPTRADFDALRRVDKT